MPEKKTRFADLSLPLKLGMIVSWMLGILWCVFFIIGFMMEMVSPV